MTADSTAKVVVECPRCLTVKTVRVAALLPEDDDKEAPLGSGETGEVYTCSGCHGTLDVRVTWTRA